MLLLISGFLSGVMILIGSNPDNVYTFRTSFESEILETGYKFVWEKEPLPDYHKYNPEMKK